MKRPLEVSEWNEKENNESGCNRGTLIPEGFETLAHPIFMKREGGCKRTKRHECPVCMNTVKDAVTPQACSHVFCTNCIRSWARHCCKLAMIPNCPVCKKEVRGLVAFGTQQSVTLNLVPN